MKSRKRLITQNRVSINHDYAVQYKSVIPINKLEHNSLYILCNIMVENFGSTCVCEWARFCTCTRERRPEKKQPLFKTDNVHVTHKHTDGVTHACQLLRHEHDRRCQRGKNKLFAFVLFIKWRIFAHIWKRCFIQHISIDERQTSPSLLRIILIEICFCSWKTKKIETMYVFRID